MANKKKSISKYLNEACKILEVKNSFRTENLNNNLNLVEFQQSNTYFPEKYYSEIEKSKNINLYLECPVVEIIGDDYLTKKIKCFDKRKKNIFILIVKFLLLRLVV